MGLMVWCAIGSSEQPQSHSERTWRFFRSIPFYDTTREGEENKSMIIEIESLSIPVIHLWDSMHPHPISSNADSELFHVILVNITPYDGESEYTKIHWRLTCLWDRNTNLEKPWKMEIHHWN